jgi:hypothetical protein
LFLLFVYLIQFHLIIYLNSDDDNDVCDGLFGVVILDEPQVPTTNTGVSMSDDEQYSRSQTNTGDRRQTQETTDEHGVSMSEDEHHHTLYKVVDPLIVSVCQLIAGMIPM